MVKNLEHVKKVSLAFAITCTVAASFTSIHAGKLGAGVEVGTDTKNDGSKELFAKESVTFGKGHKEEKTSSPKSSSSIFGWGKKDTTTTHDVAGKTTADYDRYKEQAKAKASHAADTASHVYNEAKYNAKETAGAVKDTVVGGYYAAKEAVKDTAYGVKDAAQYEGHVAADKIADKKETVFSKAKNGAFLVLGLPILAVKKTSDLVFHNQMMEYLYAKVGCPYKASPEAFWTGVVVGAAGVYVGGKLINYQIDKEVIKNMTTEDAQNIVAAHLISDHARYQADYNTVATRVAARGFATPDEEVTINNLQSNIKVTEKCLAKVLRANKSLYEQVKIALHLN